MQCGLRWDKAGSSSNNWYDILAVVHTEPEDGPIHRAEKPDEWQWYTLSYNHLQTIVEVLATGNILLGNQSGAKKSDFPTLAERPWDKMANQEVKEFKFDPTPLAALDSWLDSRIQEPTT